jgi:hypothetical protein
MGYSKIRTNKGTNNEKICTLNVNGKWIEEKQMILETFNNYFIYVAENNNAKISIIMLTVVIFQPLLIFGIYHKLLLIPSQILKSNLYQLRKL